MALSCKVKEKIVRSRCTASGSLHFQINFEKKIKKYLKYLEIEKLKVNWWCSQLKALSCKVRKGRSQPAPFQHNDDQDDDGDGDHHDVHDGNDIEYD